MSLSPSQEQSNEPEGPRQEPPTGSKAAWGPLAALGVILMALFGKLKFLLPALKVLKLGKFVTTGGTMFLSMWAYAAFYGWKFGAGFVILIFVHELGHVFVAWRQGLPISAPVFIPFMGAVIFQKREADSAWAQAWMGIGGPIGGTVGALACHGIFLVTQNPLFLGLAYVGYFLNLLNLMPAIPLDGGWIVGAISPWLWLVGLVGLATLMFTGIINNPIFILLVIFSLPRLWHGLRHGERGLGVAPATSSQKWAMGLCYIGLCGFLAYLMAVTFSDRRGLRDDSLEKRYDISTPA
jgi:Zn-dependent protease